MKKTLHETGPFAQDGQIWNAKVAILLAVRNAQAFLREQMDSYFSQDHDNWELWVSDDGSTDSTLDIVREYMNRGKRITIVDGPCRGATCNFFSLTERVKGKADFFAWSDADDIWLPDKLSRALGRVTAMNSARPALYCGRSIIVDAENRELYPSVLHLRPPSFKNALCQNIGGGNTMLFNHALRDLLCANALPNIAYHDWWAYILATGCGGEVYYDSEPCLRYRQHGANLTGCNLGLKAKLWRGMRLFRGVAAGWNRLHAEMLRQRAGGLTPENRAVFESFTGAMEATTLYRRLHRLHRSGVHRQSPLHTAALYVAAALGKYP